METDDLLVSLPPEAAAPSMGRRALDGLADRLPRGRLEDARLLLSELLTNAIRHPALASDEPISVAFRISESELTVVVTSRVRGFDADAVDFSSDAGTGWGLLLLETLSDAWGSERMSDGSSVVWFRLRLGTG